MSQQRPPHRRRKPQVIPQIAGEEELDAAPHRIVIGQQDDQPDWMVAAGQISGAASRRTNADRRPAADHEVQGAAKEKREKTDVRKETQSSAGAAAGTAKAIHSVKTAKAAPAARSKKPRRMSKKARARRNAKIRRTAFGALCAIFLLVLAVAGIIGGGRLLDIKRTLDQGTDVFYPNIFVNGIPLAGKTLDEAEAVVTQQVGAMMAAWKITLRTQDGRSWDITGADLQMQFDVADQLDQLWAIGHAGPSSTRYEQVKALEETPAVRYTSLTYDLSRVNQILTQIKAEVDQPAVSATRVNDENNWPPYAYTDDVPGQELDITGLNERIIGMVDRLESGVVDLTPTVVQAPVTREYLEGQIVKLASFETSISKSSDYAEARSENIRIGTQKFDRLVIKSGESVSFNKVAGKRSAANGYQPALELAYGEYVLGYGGGICQVSSTLYNAVVNAGLEVKTRFQHSLPSSYVELGLDATVQDERLDFVFKNNTNADIFISSEYYQGKNNYWRCKFTIHGRPDPNGCSYKLESVVREEIPIPEPTYIPDEEMKYVIYDDETEQVSQGAAGYIVDVYLVTLDSQGLPVSRELQYTDTYKAQIPKVYVGVMPRETPEPQITYMD